VATVLYERGDEHYDGRHGMHCYEHHEREAIGVCLSCGKGLCPDCAQVEGEAIACGVECSEALTLRVKAQPSWETIRRETRDARASAVVCGGVSLLAVLLLPLVWLFSSIETKDAALWVFFSVIGLGYSLAFFGLWRRLSGWSWRRSRRRWGH
jgi:hypothetical protein